MLWIYARNEQSLRFETRFDNETEEFILISYNEDGSQQQIERFKDEVSFKTRLIGLEKWLTIEGWHHTGAPVFLRDGWKI
jgi:hypothetical protein